MEKKTAPAKAATAPKVKATRKKRIVKRRKTTAAAATAKPTNGKATKTTYRQMIAANKAEIKRLLAENKHLTALVGLAKD